MKKLETLQFKHFCMTIGNLPSSYVESLSYYECLMWLCKYLQDTVIPTVNNNAEAVEELQGLYLELKSYVDNYFKNLDVQEEINNKLDEMVEEGTLQEIIADYLNSKAVFGFDTVSAMKNSTNLIAGSYAQTLGYYTKNDGGSALYKIREITNDDVVDEMFIIEMVNDDSLIAELIIDDEINIKKCGVVADGTTDDTLKMTAIVTKAKAGNYKILANKNDIINISSTLDLSNLYIDFNMATLKTSSEINLITINSSEYYGEIKNIVLDCNTVATAGIHIELGIKLNIKNVNITNIKQYGIYYKAGYEIIADTLHLTGTPGNNTIGLYCTSSDSMFNNIVMIDCKTGIENINGSNYFTNIHSWILTSSLIPGSIFYKANAGTCFLTNCYSDTYQYSIWVYSQIPRLEIVNFFNVYNHGIYTETIATENVPELFHSEVAGGENLTRISNSTIYGYSSSIKTKLTNLTSFNGDIVNSLMIDTDHNLPFNSVDTTTATAGVSSVSSILEKTNKTVYLKQFSSVNVGETKTFKLGTLPYYYRPTAEYIGIASYGTGQYNVVGACYLYIGITGDITVTLPSDVTGNTTIKVNTSFLTHKEQ